MGAEDPAPCTQMRGECRLKTQLQRLGDDFFTHLNVSCYCKHGEVWCFNFVFSPKRTCKQTCCFYTYTLPRITDTFTDTHTHMNMYAYTRTFIQTPEFHSQLHLKLNYKNRPSVKKSNCQNSIPFALEIPSTRTNFPSPWPLTKSQNNSRSTLIHFLSDITL